MVGCDSKYCKFKQHIGIFDVIWRLATLFEVYQESSYLEIWYQTHIWLWRFESFAVGRIRTLRAYLLEMGKISWDFSKDFQRFWRK